MRWISTELLKYFFFNRANPIVRMNELRSNLFLMSEKLQGLRNLIINCVYQVIGVQLYLKSFAK